MRRSRTSRKAPPLGRRVAPPTVYATGDVVEVGCWAHQRRYAYKALESDPERARQALGLIGELFRIERTIAEAPTRKREVVRQREARPIVERFFAWCDAEAERELDATPIAAIIGYARNQRVALSRFVEDGRLPICNKISENALRREVKGQRKLTEENLSDSGDTDGGLRSQHRFQA